MKPRSFCHAAALCCAGLAAAAARAAHETTPVLSNFTWSRPIEGSLQAGQTYRIRVPDSVYHGSHYFPLDLIIVDDLNASWPLTVWTDEPVIDYRPLQIQTEDRVVPKAGGAKYRALLVHVLAGPGEAAERKHNRLTVYAQGANAVRRVEIQGSQDQANWERVGVGYLINDQSGVSVNKRVISYPESLFPFLEVRVFADPDKSGDEPAIVRTELGYQQEVWPELEEVNLTLIPSGDLMSVILDTGVANRPVDRLRVEVADKMFYRAVKISGCNVQPFAWRWVADGEIHRLSDEEVSAIDVKRCASRYLKLDWVGGPDEKPPRVKSVTAAAFPRYLVLEARSGSAPVLYFGSEQIPERRSPRQVLRDEQQTGQAPLAQLRDEQPTAAGRRPPASRTLLAVLIAAAGVLVLGGLLRKSLARPRSPTVSRR